MSRLKIRRKKGNVTARSSGTRVWLVVGLFILFLPALCQEMDMQANIFADRKPYPLVSSTSIFSIPKTKVQSAKEPASTPEKQDIWTVPAQYSGGIISSNEQSIEAILKNIPDKNVYKTLVILAPTSHETDQNKIFTYDNVGVLASKNILFDEETIQKLTADNLIASLGAISESSYWSGPLLPLLQKYFPEAKFIPISVSDKALAYDAEITAYLLQSYLPESSLVFAVGDFQPAVQPKLQEFQNNFTRTVLENFDSSKFDELPLKNLYTVQTLAHYLRFMGAQKPQHLIMNPTIGAQVLFAQGKAEPTNGPVYFVAFGDLMLGRAVRAAMDANTLDYPFQKMDNDYLRVNDILIGNLEGPVTKNSVRTVTGMSFGFFPDVVPILKQYHFDVISQANNHTLDKGQLAWEESMTLLRNGGITAFGHPKELNNDSVAKLNIRGQKFAFIGLEEVNFTIDDEKSVQLVKDLTQEGYRVIPYIHWGIEYTHTPNTRQQDLAHKFIDAGAVAVIAHHPHVVQAYETYNGRPIIYSLGNAVFDQYWSAETQVGLSIALEMSDDALSLYLVPIKLPGSQMELMNEDQTKAFLEQMTTYGEYSEEEKQMILEGKITLPLNS